MTTTDLNVREALDAVPRFAGARGLTAEPLRDVQSLNNNSWIVYQRGSAEKYVVRIANPTTGPHLGIRRDEEGAAARAAAAAGVAPEVVHYDPSNGLMVTRWIESARAWDQDDFGDSSKVARLVEVLRRMHAVTDLPDEPGSVFRRIRHLAASAHRLGIEAPGKLDDALLRLADIEAERAYPAPGLNHNDLWGNNILDDGTRIWLVDWEFAGSGDGFYDLATTSMAGGYGPAQDAWLLGEYGLAGAEHLAALRSMKWVVRFFEAMWSLVMHTVHVHPGFDYLTHASNMFAALDGD